MRRLPCPVAIVTASSENETRGITIGSFTSLSLDPPLISYNIRQDAQMHPVLAEVRYFSVHIPGPAQAKLCNRFAVTDITGSEQFSGLSYFFSEYGTPVLRDTVAVIHCKKHDRVTAGDHSIIIGEVLDVDLNESNQSSILYFNRAYHKIGDQLLEGPS